MAAKKSKRRPHDERITYDGDLGHLDEIVIDDTTVHIERMSQHGWYIGIQRGNGLIQGWFSDLAISVVDDKGLPKPKVGPALLGCDHEWTTDDYRTHRCYEMTVDHDGLHTCDCGDAA